jgi:hypothetical protein
MNPCLNKIRIPNFTFYPKLHSLFQTSQSVRVLCNTIEVLNFELNYWTTGTCLETISSCYLISLRTRMVDPGGDMQRVGASIATVLPVKGP